jgi:hypothetical protein
MTPFIVTKHPNTTELKEYVTTVQTMGMRTCAILEPRHIPNLLSNEELVPHLIFRMFLAISR